MDAILLGVTVVALVMAFIMSVTAWRLQNEEKKRAAARVAALSLAAASGAPAPVASVETPVGRRAPWGPMPSRRSEPIRVVAAVAPAEPEIVLNEPKPQRELTPHASGFLGTQDVPTADNGNRQRSLAVAAAALFVVMSLGLVWMMSAPRGTTAVAMGPNSPLELVSLRHDRQNAKLAVSGLVRNPANGKPVERLLAVVFLFDRQGGFVTSGRANVDFLKLGSGDETPFVVALDAPSTVARYRVSFRTDEGVVPHVDKRGAPPIATEAEPVSVSLK